MANTYVNMVEDAIRIYLFFFFCFMFGFAHKPFGVVGWLIGWTDNVILFSNTSQGERKT